MNKIYALVDCNSFYASCERVFRPDLRNTPIVVLSNNDGCIVALTKEAKAIPGITRGKPIFQIMDLIEYNNVSVFSSNYELYADLSDRVMNILRDFTFSLEVYSIDEAFLDLSGIECDLIEYGKKIKYTVEKLTGIPVSVGIGTSKTQAKLANKYSKKHNGVYSLVDNPDINNIYENFPIFDVWYIGGQLTKKLNDIGVYFVSDFLKLNNIWIKKNMSIRGLYTKWELQGKSCMDLEEEAPDKQNIVSSRSFGIPVTTLKHMKEALAYYVTLACEKLRNQNSVCTYAVVFVGTNNFNETKPQYHNSKVVNLEVQTNYTPDIIDQAITGLEKIYKTGYEYKRCGIMLGGIVPEANRQLDLFIDNTEIDKKANLLKVLDKINRKQGNNTIHSSAFGYRKVWDMHRDLKSPGYTTEWCDLAIVR